jgi:hypothetical protein
MRHLETLLLALCLMPVAACANGDHLPSQLPYEANTTKVVGGKFDNAAGLAPTDYSTPNGEECVSLDGPCVQPQHECGDDGTALVLLDAEGAVADVICYPRDGVVVDAYEGDVRNTGNNVVLVLDDQDDGPDVTGDVTIDGNNVTLYGYGPDRSVIAGDLHIDKNNTLVSGIRVQGDVVIDKNNPSMVDCVIEGDLTIHGNNVSMALCEVWGTLTVDGNNAVLAANKFQNAPVVTGQNLRCSSNMAFRDQNHDNAVSADELTGPITCSSEKVAKKP